MLLLDLGNSRLKWRLEQAEGLCKGSFDYRAEMLTTAPFWSSLQAGETVWLASVGQTEIVAALDQLVLSHSGTCLQIARSEAMQGGLVNGYREPARLGVDRWLAMLAAWRECRCRCVVIDAGSALTVDLIAENGQHEGGHIVPGANLQWQSLLQQTAQVRFEPRAVVTAGPGRDTQSAVTQGVCAQLAGYLRYLIQDAWAHSAAAPVVFITGGDAPWLAPLLALPVNHRPALVLDGLHHYALEHPV